jgi:hypothetical protein
MAFYGPTTIKDWLWRERTAAWHSGFDCSNSKLLVYLIDLGIQHYDRAEFFGYHGVAEEEE